MKFGLIAARHPGDIGFWPNLGFGYLSAYLQKTIGYDGVVVAEGIEELVHEAPDLVGISSVSQDYTEAIRLTRQVKHRLGVPVLIGGVHITALPSTLPAEADLAVLSEGEETTRELVALYLDKGKLAPCDLAGIRGIAYREAPGGPVKPTDPRPLIEPLDQIPYPDRGVLRYEGEDTYLFTSRGCPFNCCFCSSRIHWGKRLRCFSAEYVTEEIRQLHERYGTRRIHFYDDLFIADRKRLSRMRELWRKEPWHGKISFSCAVRAEWVDRALVETLREMNFTRVTFGAESHCKRVLQYLKGKSSSPGANQRAVDLCAEGGLRMALSFIKGVPGETREELEQTYRFITANLRRRNIDGADIGLLVPFPGTEIWDLARKAKLVSEEMDWGLLRNPWEGLVLSPAFQDYEAWDMLYGVKVKELQALGSWEVLGILTGSPGLPMAELLPKLKGVRNVTRWILPEAFRPSCADLPDVAVGLISFAEDPEKGWVVPARKRIHLRVAPESLKRPEAVDGLIWHLYENRLPAVRWIEDGKLMAEAIVPHQPARRGEPEWAAYSPGDSPLDPSDGIPERPKMPSVVRAACRQAVALAEALQQRGNQLARAEKQHKRTEDALREQTHRIEKLEHERDERSQWALRMEEQLKEAREEIRCLQEEIQERTRWAQALDEELQRWRSGQVRFKEQEAARQEPKGELPS